MLEAISETNIYYGLEMAFKPRTDVSVRSGTLALSFKESREVTVKKETVNFFFDFFCDLCISGNLLNEGLPVRGPQSHTS